MFGRIMPVPDFSQEKLQQTPRREPGAVTSCLRGSGPKGGPLVRGLAVMARAIARTTVLVILMGAFTVSCGDKNRRMGERESLDFRRNLVRKNYGGLSPDQRWRVMHHPGRTKREIRSTLDSYLKDTVRRRQAEAAAGSGRTGAGRAGAGQTGAGRTGAEDVVSPGEAPAVEGESRGADSGREDPGSGEAEAGSSTDDSSPDRKAGDS
jgi:hypothetical protein